MLTPTAESFLHRGSQLKGRVGSQGEQQKYHDLIAENVSFHSHAKFDGYDTIHTTSPAAFSIELNGEFESHALTTPNAFDYCTWDTEDAKFSLSTPPQFEGCNIKY